MKEIGLGQILRVLANLAVVAGVVFLATQIREERDYAIIEDTTIVGHGIVATRRESTKLAGTAYRGRFDVVLYSLSSASTPTNAWTRIADAH